jgi:1,4-alpha-glucan branching enzyme
MNAEVSTFSLYATCKRQVVLASSHSEATGEAVMHLMPQVLHRDPADIRTILSLTWMGLLFTVLLLMSVGLNIYQYLRRPDRIVVGP